MAVSLVLSIKPKAALNNLNQTQGYFRQITPPVCDSVVDVSIVSIPRPPKKIKRRIRKLATKRRAC